MAGHVVAKAQGPKAARAPLPSDGSSRSRANPAGNPEEEELIAAIKAIKEAQPEEAACRATVEPDEEPTTATCRSDEVVESTAATMEVVVSVPTVDEYGGTLTPTLPPRREEQHSSSPQWNRQYQW